MKQSISIQRWVEWMDTDAAGIWHHSTVIRWTEEAEAALHRRLGIIGETFGVTPRVNIEYTFRAPLEFGDQVDVSLEVAKMGESSIVYEVTVDKGGDTVVTGRMIAVHIDRDTKKKKPWSDQVRKALTGG